MPELTEQEKLERRRQKRQQRILASAGDRLSKITGTAFPHRLSPSPSPSTSTSASSLAPTESLSRELPRSRSPSPALFGLAPPPSEPTRRLPQRRLSDDPSEALGAPPPLGAHEIHSRSIDEFMGGSPFGAHPQGAMPDNLSALNDLFGGQLPFNPALLAGMQQQQQQQQQQQEIQNENSTKYWNLVHIGSMVWLACYAIYTEWSTLGTERFATLLYMSPNNMPNAYHPAVPFPLFWYFITLELLMQTSQIIYHQGQIPTNSILGTLATQLPHPFSTVITVAMRYRSIFSCLVQDGCILVFIIGLAQVISAVLLK